MLVANRTSGVPSDTVKGTYQGYGFEMKLLGEKSPYYDRDDTYHIKTYCETVFYRFPDTTIYVYVTRNNGFIHDQTHNGVNAIQNNILVPIVNIDS